MGLLVEKWFADELEPPSAPPSFLAFLAFRANTLINGMKKNVASQVIGVQMISATDGSAFTGAVTVSVTGDAGTQATGSVGSGACTHEGNGYHTYAPAQAETNYDQIGFTFTGTGAIPATVQVYTTFPQTGDNFARLGAPAGASVSADVAAIKAETATILADTNDIQTRIPAALVSGRMDSSVGAMASGVLTATAIAADAITDAKVASDVTIASVTGAVGSVTGNVGGNVTGSVGSVATGGIAAASFAAGAIDAAAIATDAIGALELAAGAASEIATAVWAESSRTLTAIDEDSTTLDLDATIRGAMGLASANLDTQLDALPTAAENATAVWGAGTRSLTILDEDSTTLDLDATIRSAIGLASANLDTQIGTLATAANLATVDTVVDAIKVTTDKLDDTVELTTDGYIFTVNALEQAPTGGSAPSAADIADAVWEEAIADHSGTAGSTAEALAAAGSAGDPWITALPGAYTAGQAGYIVGTNLNATVSSRATQTSVDDLPTNAELATALGTADDAVLAILGTPAGASLSADVAAVKAQTAAIETDTQDIQSRLPAALVSGRIDASVGAMAANTLTASALATDAVTEIQSGLSTLTAAGVRTAVGLASANLDTQLDAVPTATENADALLNRDMSAVSDSNSRSPLNALRMLRNKWSNAAGTLTVTKEDDTTEAWTAALSTDAGAEPITGIDPG